MAGCRLRIVLVSGEGGAGPEGLSRYVAEGINEGPRPELVGGGLARSLGGWPAVKSLRRPGERVLTDERILGTDDFVGRVSGEADHRTRHLFSSLLTGKQVEQIIAKSCKEEGISLQELQRGSRRGPIPRVRSHLAWKLARELGVSLAEIGRQSGVSTSAISQILDRKKMR